MTDEQLLREALEALRRCAPYIEGHFKAWPHESDRQALNRTRGELIATAAFAITKLEARLLNE